MPPYVDIKTMILRKTALTSQMPLTREKCSISVFLKCLGKGELFLGKLVIVMGW